VDSAKTRSPRQDHYCRRQTITSGPDFLNHFIGLPKAVTASALAQAPRLVTIAFNFSARAIAQF
jgi:hypothetical protein